MKKLSFALIIASIIITPMAAKADSKSYNFIHMNIAPVGIMNYPDRYLNQSIILGILPLDMDLCFESPFIWHGELSVNVYVPGTESSFGMKWELGGSYVISGKWGYVDYRSVGADDKYVYGYSGSTDDYFYFALDYGVQGQFLSYDDFITGKNEDHHYGDASFIAGYLGFRLTDMVASAGTINEWEIKVRGLAGYASMDDTAYDWAYYEYDLYGVTPVIVSRDSYNNKLAYGGELYLRWWLLHARGGYFNGQWFWNASLIVSMAFNW